MTPSERADLAALVELANVAVGGLTARVYRLTCALAPPVAEVPNPARLAKPDAEAEPLLRDARRAQRSTAGVVQQLDQIRVALQRQALGLVLAASDAEPSARAADAASVSAVIWQQLRASIADLDALIDRLTGATLTAAGPGPIEAGDTPRVPCLAALLAEVTAGDLPDPNEGEPDA